MKTQIYSFLLVLAACLFYLSIATIPIGILSFIFDPNLFYVLVVLLAISIVSIYSLVMKKNPGFQRLLSDFWEQVPPFG